MDSKGHGRRNSNSYIPEEDEFFDDQTPLYESEDEVSRRGSVTDISSLMHDQRDNSFSSSLRRSSLPLVLKGPLSPEVSSIIFPRLFPDSIPANFQLSQDTVLHEEKLNESQGSRLELDFLIDRASQIAIDRNLMGFLNSEEIDAVFKHIIVGKGANPALLANKHDILSMAFANLGWDANKQLTVKELPLLEEQLANIVYMDGYLPDFFSSLNFVVPAGEENYAAFTKSLLMHLTRGLAFGGQKGEAEQSSSLVLDKTLLLDLVNGNNLRLRQMLRDAVQSALESAYAWLQSGRVNLINQKHYEIFQSTLLAAYFSVYPREESPSDTSRMTLVIPQMKNPNFPGKWEMREYTITRFDLSPPSAPLSWVLEAEDSFYAYGLVSETNAASSMLFLPGMVPHAAANTGLMDLFNFYPRHSVGEKFRTDEIDAWLKAQTGKKVEIAGYGEGATLAMILAARHPSIIIKATGLNPTALSSNTYHRLSLAWNALLERPLVQMIVQEGDPFYALEKHFLQGTQVYRLIPNTKKTVLSLNASGLFPLNILPKSWFEKFKKAYEAHVHQFAGRESALFLRVNVEKEHLSKQREFLHDVKYVYTLLRFPALYTTLFANIVTRKIQRFYANHKMLINSLIIAAALGACAVLINTGVLVPVVEWIVQPVLGLLNVGSTAGLTSSMTVGLSVVVSALLPLALQMTFKLTSVALAIVDSVLALTALMVAGTLAGIKVGLRSLGEFLCCRDTRVMPGEGQSQRRNSEDAGSVVALVSPVSSAISSSSLVTATIQNAQKRLTRHKAWKEEENKKIQNLASELIAIIAAEKTRLQGSYNFDPETDSLSSDDEDDAPKRRRGKEGSFSLTRVRMNLVHSPTLKAYEPVTVRTTESIDARIISRFAEINKIQETIQEKTKTMLEDGLASYENYRNQIDLYLGSVQKIPELDKYRSDDYAKLAIRLFNVLWGITVVPPIIKSYVTGRGFFSTVGKSKEAVEKLHAVSRTAVISGLCRS